MSTTTASLSAAAVVAVPSAGSAEIDLDTIRHMTDGRLVVAFSSGEQKWEVRCTAAQVQKFDAFQRTVAGELGLWIRHSCEDERRARDVAEHWQREVAAAFDRGAKR